MAWRIGVIGGGMMGAIHARAWRASGHGDVVAVHDLDAAVAQRLATATGAVVTLDLDDLLQRVDAISVCTPPDAHAAAVGAAASRGVHVLLEKPSARTLAEHDAIADAVRGSAALVMVGTTSRFYPESRAAKARLERDGEPLIALRERVRLDHAGLPAWYGDPAIAGGGVTLTNGIHAIDRMLWLSGAERAEVRGVTMHPEPLLETIADLHLRLRGGAVSEAGLPAHLQLVWQRGVRGASSLELVRARDTINVDTWSRFEVDGPDPELLEPYPAEATFEERTEIGIRAQIDALVAAAAGAAPLESGLDEHRRALAAIDAAYRAAQGGRP